MQIAIVHFHLNRGGVTQVIANHLRALNTAMSAGERARVLVLYGGRREGWSDDVVEQCPHLDITLVEVASLEYDGRLADATSAGSGGESLAADILSALTAHDFSPGETLLHIHNHSIGKKWALPAAVRALAKRGIRQLLQVHDFAEDFRPELYEHLVGPLAGDEPDRLPELLYPQAEQIHYGVLNGRDREVLSTAGVATSHLHWLPNPVAEFESLPSREEARQALAERFGVGPDDSLLLYPVRGIRRKNLGEILLLSAAADGLATFATTLAPLNPLEKATHDEWVELAAELELPCLFGTGEEGGLSFAENLAAADAIVTTSVAEGFGMVFLEAWLAGRPLLGRNLSDITADFVEHGLQYEDLYERISIPIEWIGEEAFRVSLAQSFEAALEQYGRADQLEERFDEHYDELIDFGTLGQGTVDFASLTVELQRQVIVMVAQSASHRDELLQTNRGLQRAFLANAQACSDEISHNASVIRENYSLEVFGKRLRQLYENILAGLSDGEVAGPASGEKILDTFLDVRRFRPLRTEVAVGDEA